MVNQRLTKECHFCKAVFLKPKNYSKKQWEAREYCSRKCGASKITIPESKVAALYLSDKLSSEEIGRKYDISGVQVRRILKKQNIEIRPSSENKKISHSRQNAKEKMRKSATGRRLSESAKEKLRALTGIKNAQWGGGLTLSTGGYLQFSASPANGEHSTVFLHRLIAEWKYGRRVKKGEHVHHIDGNKLNNHPDNLVILSASQHATIHTEDRENGKRS